MSALLIQGINPEPWAVGPLGIGRRGAKPYPYLAPNQVLQTYQEALRESITKAYPDLPMFPRGVPLTLHMVFWRQIQSYRSSDTGKMVTRHRADTTNCQKATEDALQNLLYVNDVDVRHVSSEMWEQEKTTEPQILIVCKPYVQQTDWKSYVQAITDYAPPPTWPEPGSVYYIMGDIK